MSRLGPVIANELRMLWRSGAARGGFALAAGLVLVSLLLSVERLESSREERQRLAELAEVSWAAQPDRHPHRVVHFGDFVFRNVTPLAAFDLGVDAYSGHALFLEGHRQNPSNFSEAEATGAVLRFAQLTPAFVLHTLAPLLLLYLGAGSIAGERESGRLDLLASLGASHRSIFLGKAIGLLVVGLLLVVPAGLWLAFSASGDGDRATRAGLLLVGYLVYLGIWSAGIVTVSGLTSTRRAALLALLAVWVLGIVVAPRLTASFAPLETPAPSRVESEIIAERELLKVGDSHNPEDPYFNRLRERTLTEHRVERTEDLPFNYGGLVMLEGERLTTELYNKQFEQLYSRLRGQSRAMSHAGWLTPFQAMRNLSQRSAGVDLEHQLHFLAAGEARRYAMVQNLNELHRTLIRSVDDRGQRIDASHWAAVPREDYVVPRLEDVPGDSVTSLLQLVSWLGLAVGLLLWIGARQ